MSCICNGYIPSYCSQKYVVARYVNVYAKSLWADWSRDISEALCLGDLAGSTVSLVLGL